MMWLGVSLCGALGALFRYLAGIKIMERYPRPAIPLAILLVNLSGSFGLGLTFALYVQDMGLDMIERMPPWYSFITLGFFGAFTTFSTFSVETFQLLERRRVKQAGYYIVLSMIGSILFFYLGYSLSSLISIY